MDNKELNQTSEIKYLTNQLNIARSEINNLRQQLKALTQSHRKECDDIRNSLKQWRCLNCQEKREEPAAASSSSATNNEDLLLRYIGIVSTQFPEKRGTPRQSSICSDLVAKLTLSNDIFTNPKHALEGLQEYSHMWILFHFHKNETIHVRAKVSPPRLNGLKMGVFATRSPHRPCPIGLSLVKIIKVEENNIYFSGVDMIDQTPVLDLKPYIPQYDNPSLLSSTLDLEENSTERLLSSPHTVRNIDTHAALSLQELNLEVEGRNIRIMDGEENGSRDDSAIDTASSLDLSTRSNIEESFYSRSDSRIGEREAPDGEEEESPRQPQASFDHVSAVTAPEGDVRVPPWVHRPPSSTFTVIFKDRALAQLRQLGADGEIKKNIITNVLREDPRSVYLRERWGSHCYVFRIAELYVSCKFNDSLYTVTVYQAFLNSEPELDE